MKKLTMMLVIFLTISSFGYSQSEKVDTAETENQTRYPIFAIGVDIVSPVIDLIFKEHFGIIAEVQLLVPNTFLGIYAKTGFDFSAVNDIYVETLLITAGISFHFENRGLEGSGIRALLVLRNILNGQSEEENQNGLGAEIFYNGSFRIKNNRLPLYYSAYLGVHSVIGEVEFIPWPDFIIVYGVMFGFAY